MHPGPSFHQQPLSLYGCMRNLHTFKDNIEFLDMGFSQAGPYYAWMEAVDAHQDRTGIELLDELGFLPNEVLMLGMNYMDEDFSESELSAIEYFEGKIQAGLAAARCTELGSVQETIQAASEARRAYVDPMSRPPAAADDFDERVVNPCIVAGIARNPELDGVTPWEVRNIYPEIYDPLVAQMRDVAAPFLAEFGDTPLTRNILFDRLRADCIRGTRGEGTLELVRGRSPRVVVGLARGSHPIRDSAAQCKWRTVFCRRAVRLPLGQAHTHHSRHGSGTAPVRHRMALRIHHAGAVLPHA